MQDIMTHNLNFDRLVYVTIITQSSLIVKKKQRNTTTSINTCTINYRKINRCEFLSQQTRTK